MDSRFGPLARVSYNSPALPAQRICHQSRPEGDCRFSLFLHLRRSEAEIACPSASSLVKSSYRNVENADFQLMGPHAERPFDALSSLTRSGQGCAIRE